MHGRGGALQHRDLPMREGGLDQAGADGLGGGRVVRGGFAGRMVFGVFF